MKTTMAQTAATPDLSHDNQEKGETQQSLPLGVTTLICTRNRGDSVVAAVRSVLECAYPEMELIVVDQSTNDETANAVAPFLPDKRLRYLRTTTQGKGHALNIGIEAARNEIVVITDDDCQVMPDWALAHAQAFHDNARVAVTFGNVLALDYDTKAGFTPVYLRKDDFLCRSVWQKLYARGIGANMALRRQVALDIGGFDPELGPGGRFPSCEDGDFAVRCLLAGHYVFETSGSTVTHFGFRTWDQGRKLTRDAFYGIGAAYVKPLKCGRLSVLPLLVFEFLRYALYPSLAATLGWRPGKPTNWQRVHFFLRGILRGLRVPVNRTTLVYLPRPDAAIEDKA